MKTKDIAIGSQYLTTVGGTQRRVVVLATKQAPNARDKFEIQRIVKGERYGSPLPKWRTAAALHSIPESQPTPTPNPEITCPASE